jgi:hypothetical protein
MAVVNVPAPTAEQLQERAWMDAGRQYMSNCEPQVAKEITNLLKSFPKSTNTNRFVGWLCHAGRRAGRAGRRAGRAGRTDLAGRAGLAHHCCRVYLNCQD